MCDLIIHITAVNIHITAINIHITAGFPYHKSGKKAGLISEGLITTFGGEFLFLGHHIYNILLSGFDSQISISAGSKWNITVLFCYLTKNLWHPYTPSMDYLLTCTSNISQSYCRYSQIFHTWTIRDMAYINITNQYATRVSDSFLLYKSLLFMVESQFPQHLLGDIFHYILYYIIHLLIMPSGNLT